MSTTPGAIFPWNTQYSQSADLRVGESDTLSTNGTDQIITDDGDVITADPPAWMWLVNVSKEHASEPAGFPFSWDHIGNYASAAGLADGDTLVGGQILILQLAFFPGDNDPLDDRWAGNIPNDGPEGVRKETTFGRLGNWLSNQLYANLYYNDSLMTPLTDDAAYSAGGDWKLNIPPTTVDAVENPGLIQAEEGTFESVMAWRHISGGGTTEAVVEHRPIKRWALQLPYEDFTLTLKGGSSFNDTFYAELAGLRDKGLWGGENSSITYSLSPEIPPGTEVLPKFSEAWSATNSSTSSFECNTQELNQTNTITTYTRRIVTNSEGSNVNIWDGQMGYRTSAGLPPGSPVDIQNPNLVHYGDGIYIYRKSPCCFYGQGATLPNPGGAAYNVLPTNPPAGYPQVSAIGFSMPNLNNGTAWHVNAVDAIGNFGEQTWDVYFVPHGTAYFELPKNEWDSGTESDFSLDGNANGAVQAYPHAHVNMKIDGGITDGLTATLSNVGRIRKSDGKTIDPCTAVGYWVTQDSLVGQATGTLDWSDDPQVGFVSVLPHATFGYNIFNCGGWSWFGILTSYTSITGVEYFINYDIDFSTQPNNIEWFPQANWLPITNWGD